jgi:hypothetical protein
VGQNLQPGAVRQGSRVQVSVYVDVHIMEASLHAWTYTLMTIVFDIELNAGGGRGGFMAGE